MEPVIDWSGMVLPKLQSISIYRVFCCINVEDIIGSRVLKSCTLDILVRDQFTMPPNYYTGGAITLRHERGNAKYNMHFSEDKLWFADVVRLDLTDARRGRVCVQGGFSYAKFGEFPVSADVTESANGEICIFPGCRSLEKKYANHEEFEAAEGQSLSELLHIKPAKSAMSN